MDSAASVRPARLSRARRVTDSAARVLDPNRPVDVVASYAALAVGLLALVVALVLRLAS